MRYKVPHYIEREAKILGPASFSQLGYLAVAAFVILLLFVVFGGTSPIFYTLAFLVGAVGIAFAFFQKNGEPLPSYIKKVIFFSTSYKRYLWKKKDYIIKVNQPSKRKKEEPVVKQKKKKATKGRLSDVNKFIETA
ncbi:MAG: PrgI family protein [Candidatus Pacebacteria bacterium]|nr:PrgI family protein [Candidatus Paceibacterota bacterium]